MGLLDKVKAQATAATEQAKDLAQKGQAKLNEVQSLKGSDGMLRDLGAAYYASQTGRSTPTTESDITRLVAALQAHEAEHGSLTLAPTTPAAAPTAAPTGSAPPPPSHPVNDAAAPPPPPPPAPAAPASPPPPPPTAQTI
jgi:hypothetical protein